MKYIKSIFFLFVITLLFACKKEEPFELPTEVTVTYRLVGTDEEAELHQVRFLDAEGNWQTVEQPDLDWEYKMTAPRGFMAEMEMDGFLPDAPPGQPFFKAYVRLKGEGYGCWSSSHFTEVPGNFTIRTAYQMGKEE